MTIYKRRFLKQSIDSVLAQTCRDFELVMVDDKSPEALFEVIEEYPWGKHYETLPDGGRRWMVDGIPVRYYQNEEDIGEKDLVAAWNHAMEYATAEWCVLASDDDVYMPEYLAEMLRLCDKYPQCDLFYCRCAVIDADGKWIKVSPERIEFESQIQMAYSRTICRFQQTAPEFMFRKSAWDAIGGFVNFPLAWYSDDATWMLLSKNGAACSQKVLFNFRFSGINITSRTDLPIKKIKACELFEQWFLDFCSILKPDNEEEVFLKRQMLEKAHRVINSTKVYYMSLVGSFSLWRKALKSANLDGPTVRICIYNRYPRLKALRMLLPI